MPSREDWDKLVTTAGGQKTAGKKLKSKSGWNKNGNGTNDYGFSALPGGNRYYSNGNFYYAGNIGFWWTATENGSYAYRRSMLYGNDYVYEYGNLKSYGFSARCVEE